MGKKKPPSKPKKPSFWGSPSVTLSAPTAVALNVTSVGTSLAIVAPGAQVELPDKSGPASLTLVLSFRVPVQLTGKQRLVGFVQDITLGITKGNDARVAVTADLGGTAKTFEAGFAHSTATPMNDALRIERFFSPQGLESAAQDSLGVSGKVPDYEATLVITAQRRDTGHVIVSVDALDIFAIVV